MEEPELGIAVFSATKFADRLVLGERITTWLRARQDVEIVDKIVVQSSDTSFHCLTIALVYRREKHAA